MTAPRVVVIGDLACDVVVRMSAAPAPGSDTDVRTTVADGGSGGNVAAWLAAAGQDVGLVGRVGRDAFGERLVAGLKRAGVHVAAAADPERATGVIVALVDPAGERTMLSDRGANLALRPKDLPEPWFRPGAHLHLSGYTLLDPGPRPAGRAALALAAEKGMTASVDPASWRPLERAGARAFLQWTSTARLCLPNITEAAVLTGSHDPAVAARLLAQTYDEVVVTRGPSGAVWSDGAHQEELAAMATTVLDTTGAGDAFAAGFLSAWLDGAVARHALAEASRSAALAVRTLGARPPTSRPPAPGR